MIGPNPGPDHKDLLLDIVELLRGIREDTPRNDRVAKGIRKILQRRELPPVAQPQTFGVEAKTVQELLETLVRHNLTDPSLLQAKLENNGDWWFADDDSSATTMPASAGSPNIPGTPWSGGALPENPVAFAVFDEAPSGDNSSFAPPSSTQGVREPTFAGEASARPEVVRPTTVSPAPLSAARVPIAATTDDGRDDTPAATPDTAQAQRRGFGRLRGPQRPRRNAEEAANTAAQPSAAATPAATPATAAPEGDDTSDGAAAQ